MHLSDFWGYPIVWGVVVYFYENFFTQAYYI